jgi:hypothetical protein
MTDFRDRFELQLIEAMGRTPAAQPARKRRWWPRRRGLISVAIAFAAAATTLAATHPWSPSVGTKRFNEPPPSLSASAPPAQELRRLGVLRREQAPADRGPGTLEALRFISPSGNQGVRLAYVRALEGGAATLVPVEKATENQAAPPIVDALCVFYAEPVGEGGARLCWSLDDVTGGRARGELGDHAFGLVPDGVVSVNATLSDGSTVTAPVVDNFYDVAVPTGAGHATAIQWLDRAGRPVKVG